MMKMDQMYHAEMKQDPNIKAGDLLICVDPGPYNITKGKSYIAKGPYGEECRYIKFVDDEGQTCGSYKSRFKKATHNTMVSVMRALNNGVG